MNLPKITIITPSYNQGEFIEETICSVLNQQYPNLEYIIIDGGSTDNTVEIIKKYEKYITYWVSEKDNGQSDAINKGYKRATGQIINWLNSDDYYEQGALLKVGEAFKDPAVNVYGGISRVFGQGKEYYSAGTDVYTDNLEKTIGWARIDQPETFFRKTVWDKLGGINSQFHYVMDKEFWIRYLFAYGLTGISKSKELLVNFRLHGNSKTISQTNGFFKEGFNLFYTLAVQQGLTQEASFLQTNYNTQLVEIDFDCNFGDVKKVLNYFFYYHLAAAYAMNNKNNYSVFKQMVNKENLSSPDQKDYQKISLKAKLIPLTLKRWWNTK